MAEESGVGVRRRGRQEIARLAALYRKSGMGRSEFCRSHGMALSTLGRHLKKQSGEQRLSSNSMVGELRTAESALRVVTQSTSPAREQMAKLAIDLSSAERDYQRLEDVGSEIESLQKQVNVWVASVKQSTLPAGTDT